MLRLSSLIYVKSSSPPPGFLDGSLYKKHLYHGSTRDDLAVLHPDKGGEYGIYLTPRHKYARQYGPYLYRVLVNIQSPLFVDDKSEISPRDLTKQDINDLKAQGYDSIVSGGHGKIDKADEIVVFDSPQVFIL